MLGTDPEVLEPQVLELDHLHLPHCLAGGGDSESLVINVQINVINDLIEEDYLVQEDRDVAVLMIPMTTTETDDEWERTWIMQRRHSLSRSKQAMSIL
eukprot:3719476-Amphidinium_carterae.3